MIKELILNGRIVPVPVPVQTLDGAIDWLSTTLGKVDQTITRIVLDGEELDFDLSIRPNRTPLASTSKLEVQMETATELAVGSVEAIVNLSSIIRECLKPLAVNCWQGRPRQGSMDLASVLDDLRLVLDLQNHTRQIADLPGIDLSQLELQERQLEAVVATLVLANSNSDWRSVSKILLNRLEPLLADISEVAGRLETEIFRVKDSA